MQQIMVQTNVALWVDNAVFFVRSQPFERAISRPVCLAESFGVVFGGHDQLGCMGEGRVTSPADPRQELTAFFGIPRAHKLVGLKPRI
ncbi:MAG: hypothetical protein B7Y43_19115, partial [Sphingomonas sp. 28-62-20]